MYSFLKRLFDIIFSILGLIALSWVLVLAVIISSWDTQSFGLFFQKRVGQYARLFTIIKIKTLHPKTKEISRIGFFFRKTKIDELPQLINILLGDMSFVGPRPDVSGYYDQLDSQDAKILELRPGLTSEASIKYRNEEELLSMQIDPLLYNDKIIFPDKIKMNLQYYKKRNFLLDLKIILNTITKI